MHVFLPLGLERLGLQFFPQILARPLVSAAIQPASSYLGPACGGVFCVTGATEKGFWPSSGVLIRGETAPGLLLAQEA